ncbi:MAG: M3 family oligoendopeptidase [Bacteroidota bacterium]
MKKRSFLPADLSINTWDDVKPFYEQLVNITIGSATEFEQFLLQLSELESAVSEDLAWKYIKMTCDTTNKDIETQYLNFVTQIQPNIAPYEDRLNQKINESLYIEGLNKDSAYFIYFRSVKNALDLYREENIPLQAELQTLAQKYGTITGSMAVEIDGKTLTLQQASNYLKEPNRDTRKMAYETINTERYSKREELDQLFNELIALRHKVATNTGFNNFRDYMHQALGRFDYSVQDCYNFHDAIAQKVVPLCKQLDTDRKLQLQLDTLKPYDMAVDPENRKPLKPFTDGKDLLEKSIQCLEKVDPQFAANLQIMADKGFLDLESRLGKAPGGYNYPLAESGIPFIFMNAAGSLRDVETMVHESGHAMHAFLSDHLKLNAFKNVPMEVAEVASMAMELISMEGWDAFLTNPDELKRAKIEQLEGVISTLPWIAVIDAYQHWLYTNPTHTTEQRTEAWIEIAKHFETGLTDYSGYEQYFANSWQKQLHLYEVPFYYIEYGFAQLGAIAVWRNVLLNKKDGLDAYKNMLSLGYTRSIPELYKAGNIAFNFTPEYVGELFDFVWSELEKLKKN